MVNLNQVENCG